MWLTQANRLRARGGVGPTWGEWMRGPASNSMAFRFQSGDGDVGSGFEWGFVLFSSPLSVLLLPPSSSLILLQVRPPPPPPVRGHIPCFRRKDLGGKQLRFSDLGTEGSWAAGALESLKCYRYFELVSCVLVLLVCWLVLRVTCTSTLLWNLQESTSLLGTFNIVW